MPDRHGVTSLTAFCLCRGSQFPHWRPPAVLHRMRIGPTVGATDRLRRCAVPVNELQRDPLLWTSCRRQHVPHITLPLSILCLRTTARHSLRQSRLLMSYRSHGHIRVVLIYKRLLHHLCRQLSHRCHQSHILKAVRRV